MHHEVITSKVSECWRPDIVTLNELLVKSGSSLFHEIQSPTHCLNLLLPPKMITDYDSHCKYFLTQCNLMFLCVYSVFHAFYTAIIVLLTCLFVHVYCLILTKYQYYHETHVQRSRVSECWHHTTHGVRRHHFYHICGQFITTPCCCGYTMHVVM